MQFHVALVTDTGMWTQHWRNYTDRGKTKVLEERAVPVPLCSPQIPYGLALDVSWTSVLTGEQLSELWHGT